MQIHQLVLANAALVRFAIREFLRVGVPKARVFLQIFNEIEVFKLHLHSSCMIEHRSSSEHTRFDANIGFDSWRIGWLHKQQLREQRRQHNLTFARAIPYSMPCRPD